MDTYIEGLIEIYQGHNNAEHSVWMKNYMRNQFDFLGIASPLRREILKQYVKENGLPTKEQLPLVMTALWDRPEREYQYTALDILEKCKKRLDLSDVALLEWLIVNKSWWDTVDGIASQVIGYLFRNYPDQMLPYTEQWIESDNLWLNRTSLLVQLKCKQETQEQLLFDYILRCSHSNEFFIQKAIGWALREYSKTNPASVYEFIDKNQLKPLSKREGMKHILKMANQVN